MSADPISSLRDYRLSYGYSLADVAGHLDSTEDRIVAMEQGEMRPQPRENGLLAALYGVAEDEISRAIAARRVARKRPKPHRDGSVELVEISEAQETA